MQEVLDTGTGRSTMLAITITAVRGDRAAWPKLAAAGALCVLAGHVQYAYQSAVATGIVAITAA